MDEFNYTEGGKVSLDERVLLDPMSSGPWCHTICEMALSRLSKCTMRAKAANFDTFLVISATVPFAQIFVWGLALIKKYYCPFWNASKSEAFLC